MSVSWQPSTICMLLPNIPHFVVRYWWFHQPNRLFTPTTVNSIALKLYATHGLCCTVNICIFLHMPVYIVCTYAILCATSANKLIPFHSVKLSNISAFILLEVLDADLFCCIVHLHIRIEHIQSNHLNRREWDNVIWFRFIIWQKKSRVFKHFFLSINCNNNDKENWDTQKKLLLNRSHSKEEEQNKNAKQS